MANMISIYLACFRKIVQAQDVINRSFDILTPVSATRHFAKSVLRSQFQSAKASIKAVDCTQSFFTQLCHALFFSWNKFIHNLFCKNKVREITVKRKSALKKIVSCAKKSEKSPHAHQKANMRAFYAKQSIILARPNRLLIIIDLQSPQKFNTTVVMLSLILLFYIWSDCE